MGRATDCLQPVLHVFAKGKVVGRGSIQFEGSLVGVALDQQEQRRIAALLVHVGNARRGCRQRVESATVQMIDEPMLVKDWRHAEQRYQMPRDGVSQPVGVAAFDQDRVPGDIRWPNAQHGKVRRSSQVSKVNAIPLTSGQKIGGRVWVGVQLPSIQYFRLTCASDPRLH